MREFPGRKPARAGHGAGVAAAVDHRLGHQIAVAASCAHPPPTQCRRPIVSVNAFARASPSSRPSSPVIASSKHNDEGPDCGHFPYLSKHPSNRVHPAPHRSIWQPSHESLVCAHALEKELQLASPAPGGKPRLAAERRRLRSRQIHECHTTRPCMSALRPQGRQPTATHDPRQIIHRTRPLEAEPPPRWPRMHRQAFLGRTALALVLV